MGHWGTLQCQTEPRKVINHWVFIYTLKPKWEPLYLRMRVERIKSERQWMFFSRVIWDCWERIESRWAVSKLIKREPRRFVEFRFMVVSSPPPLPTFSNLQCVFITFIWLSLSSSHFRPINPGKSNLPLSPSLSSPMDPPSPSASIPTKNLSKNWIRGVGRDSDLKKYSI